MDGSAGRRWQAEGYALLERRLAPASELVLDAAQVVAGRHVLDVGTGSGNGLLAAAARGATATGVDLSPTMLARATQRCAELVRAGAVTLIRGDANRLPLPDRCADAVVSTFGVIFVPDPAEGIAEMVRCCRPGGRVAISAWRPEGWAVAARDALAPFLERAPLPFPTALGRPGALAGVLAATGLGEVGVAEQRLPWRFADLDTAIEVLTTQVAGPAEMRRAIEAAGAWGDARPALATALAALARRTTGVDEVGAEVEIDHRFVVGVGRRR